MPAADNSQAVDAGAGFGESVLGPHHAAVPGLDGVDHLEQWMLGEALRRPLPGFVPGSGKEEAEGARVETERVREDQQTSCVKNPLPQLPDVRRLEPGRSADRENVTAVRFVLPLVECQDALGDPGHGFVGPRMGVLCEDDSVERGNTSADRGDIGRRCCRVKGADSGVNV